MRHNRSRAMFVGLSASAGVLAAAAMMSAATAPTAHADDFSTILADVQGTEAIAASAFTAASTDFGNGDSADGLTQLFVGLDDDLVGVPDELQVGLIDAATGSTLFPANSFDFTFATPATFAAAVTEAQNFYTEGSTLATTIAGLPANDFADAALDNALSTFYQWILPDQILTIGQF
ncbi:hypothetical protein [Mycobacterium sp.]|uniref:hypothetical protein n=1 Tax=Mycobacterium sp. TaxID=1785 RepID=UPI003C72AFD9